MSSRIFPGKVHWHHAQRWALPNKPDEARRFLLLASLALVFDIFRDIFWNQLPSTDTSVLTIRTMNLYVEMKASPKVASAPLSHSTKTHAQASRLPH